MPILDLTKMTKDELLRLADKIKIPVKKSLLKGEILTIIKRETKRAAKIAEGKKAKARKTTSKKAPATGKRVTAKKPVSTEKSQKTKTAAALKKKKTSAKITTSVKETKTTVAKAKNRKTAAVQTKRSKSPSARKKPVSRSSSPSGYPSGKGYDIKSLQPKFELEDTAQEAKFILGKPGMHDESHVEVTPDLPMGYGDNQVVMLVRDPHWCFLYWELQAGNIEDGLRRLSRGRSEVRHVLRFHSANGKNTILDVEVDFRHRSHYQKLSPGASFYAEIGLLDSEGYFAALAVSNTVTLPLDGPSEIIDEQWITTNENFAELYILSGGEMTGEGKAGGDFGQAGSADLQHAGQERLHLSGVGRSGSAELQKVGQEMNFGYWLDAEVILYGGADLGSRIELSGKPLDLRPDGTFTARFALPEGELKLPITFISPDRAEAQTVIQNINRHTESEKGGPNQ
ncbi:hypothetical protein MNBD_NITROSPINAE05-1316 [hydrothermal vent metagenome]|uniref:Rho termination factor N-terminal domain-containing protein n=1 Tax=hydrothermal vent metagenome TaxID=652676 RepID=A0A3B1D6S0_9ZZZZ